MDKEKIYFRPVYAARNTYISSDFRYLLTPYVSSIDTELRPIVKYQIISLMTEEILLVNISDMETAKEALLELYEGE